jgi:hypothetical protein
MMSVSPSGHKAAGDGFEPSASGFRARRSAPELPRRVAVVEEGVEPSRPLAEALAPQASVSAFPPLDQQKKARRRVTPGLEGACPQRTRMSTSPPTTGDRRGQAIGLLRHERPAIPEITAGGHRRSLCGFRRRGTVTSSVVSCVAHREDVAAAKRFTKNVGAKEESLSDRDFSAAFGQNERLTGRETNQGGCDDGLDG